MWAIRTDTGLLFSLLKRSLFLFSCVGPTGILCSFILIFCLEYSEVYLEQLLTLTDSGQAFIFVCERVLFFLFVCVRISCCVASLFSPRFSVRVRLFLFALFDQPANCLPALRAEKARSTLSALSHHFNRFKHMTGIRETGRRNLFSLPLPPRSSLNSYKISENIL